MKGKLIKEVDFYVLKIDDKIIGLSDEITNNMLNYPHKLSIKNCETIANGYDLDELADENVSDIHEGQTDFIFKEVYREFFKEGFTKALEIIGDNKFNQYDVLDVVNHVLHEMVLFEGFDKQYLFPESVYHEVTTKCQSIQQNEWNVEILMEKMNIDEIREQGKGFLNASIEKPKLDENGCLILKSVE
jgi:hypothetical protein